MCQTPQQINIRETLMWISAALVSLLRMKFSYMNVRTRWLKWAHCKVITHPHLTVDSITLMWAEQKLACQMDERKKKRAFSTWEERLKPRYICLEKRRWKGMCCPPNNHRKPLAMRATIDQFIWGQTWNKSLMFRQGKVFWGGEEGH